MRFTKDNIKGASREAMKARLKDAQAEGLTAEGEVLASLIEEVEIIQAELQASTDRAKLALLAETLPEEDIEGLPHEEVEELFEQVSSRAKKGKELKAGGTVKFKAKAVIAPKAAMTEDGVVYPKHTAPDIKRGFNEVSSLIDGVKTIPLVGGESYERSFIKGFGIGGKVAANTDYKLAEPVFGSVKMGKGKHTAYAEIPKEMKVLPEADYAGVVEEGTVIAIRKDLNRQIMIGEDNIKGIFYNPPAAERVIDITTDLSISKIDEHTLDDVIFAYGGDTDVEDTATFILHKRDLREFARLRDGNGNRVHVIKSKGNYGTIDEVPYILSPDCLPISESGTAVGKYCMAFGTLSSYELPMYSDIEVAESTHAAFRKGQIAYAADGFFGGSVARWNGFIRVKKAAATP